MNQFRVIAAVAITGLVGVMPAAAQGKSGTRGGGATTHGRPTTTTTSTTATGTGTAVTSGATAHGKSADAGSRGSDKSGQKSTTTASSTANTTTTTTITGPNALSTKISSNPGQLAKINGMLPQGVTLDQATAGFRNQGQFIAALNASRNQGVSFTDLQKAMTVDGLSLGQAVRGLKTAPASTTTETGTTTPTAGTTTTGATTTTGTTTTTATSAS
jgi:hypothetical protein